jgi:hypothetical protein
MKKSISLIGVLFAAFRIVMAPSIVLAFAFPASATLVVNLTGNWNTSTSGNINYNLGAADLSVTDTISYRQLGSTPLLANGVLGTGGSYQGPTLYGAFTQYVVGGAAAPTALRATDTDRLTGTAGASTTSNAAGEFNLLYVVKKADFINGLNTQNVGFDATSSFSFIAPTWTAVSKSARAVVQNDGVWYISQAQNTDASGNTTPKIITTDAAAAQWAVWDPTTNIRFASLDFTTTVTGSTFSNIQAVGIWAALQDGTSNPNFNISTIEISAVAVPEPSTIAVLLGLCALGFVAVRRRR